MDGSNDCRGCVDGGGALDRHPAICLGTGGGQRFPSHAGIHDRTLVGNNPAVVRVGRRGDAGRQIRLRAKGRRVHQRADVRAAGEARRVRERCVLQRNRGQGAARCLRDWWAGPRAHQRRARRVSALVVQVQAGRC